MENLRKENEEQLQHQHDIRSERETQRIFGKVFNGFVPDFWNSIKWDSDCKDLLMCISSLDGVNWQLGASSPGFLEERCQSGYHIIVLHPEFKLQQITDPIPVRTLYDPS